MHKFAYEDRCSFIFGLLFLIIRIHGSVAILHVVKIYNVEGKYF